MKPQIKRDKPFIYTVFPREQTSQVMNILENLSKENVLFWFSDKFTKAEEKRIKASCGILLFVSKQLSQTEQFRKIVDYGVLYEKNILCIYLDEVEQTPWSVMQLGSQQALFVNQFTDDEILLGKIKEAEIFKSMEITDFQKKYLRNRALTFIATPIIAAIVLFAVIVYPLLIAPLQEKNKVLDQWGLTDEDLKNVTEIHIVGNEKFESMVHSWYATEDHTKVYYGVKNNSGDMENFDPMDVGSIDDLSIVKYMPNLKVLEVEAQQIKDITPVFQLEKLEILRLSCNPISSIEGIEALSNLRELSLTNTDITDVTPAMNCTKLAQLQVDMTYIDSIDGIENLTNLRQLQISQTYVDDLSGIEYLPELDYLEFERTKVNSCPVLVGKRTLEMFACNETRLDSVDCLQNVKDFGYIFIDYAEDENLIKNLDGKQLFELAWAGSTISSLNELAGITIKENGHLGLAWNHLETLDGIENFEGISVLSIHHSQNLTDLTPIMSLQSLKQLDVSSDMKEMVEAQLMNAHFEIEYLDD